jgi:hypothetical protein
MHSANTFQNLLLLMVYIKKLIKTLPQIMNLRDEILVNLLGNPREVPILRKLACTKCVTLTLNIRKTTGRR